MSIFADVVVVAAMPINISKLNSSITIAGNEIHVNTKQKCKDTFQFYLKTTKIFFLVCDNKYGAGKRQTYDSDDGGSCELLDIIIHSLNV